MRLRSELDRGVDTRYSMNLVTLSGIESFRRLYDALSGTGFYNLNPDVIRDLQSPDPGDLLKRDGSNVASVLANLPPEFIERIEAYLGKVVPGISGVGRRLIGPRETLEFRQEVRGAQHPWRLFANNMSDGTLRAFGVLVALFQGVGNRTSDRRLVGIEEPEVALHPAAAEVLIDSLRDAAEHTQVLVTSHSPELLDNQAISDDSIVAVVADHGESRIGPLDEVGRSALRDRLYTVGELLKMNQIEPDPGEAAADSEGRRIGASRRARRTECGGERRHSDSARCRHRLHGGLGADAAAPCHQSTQGPGHPGRAGRRWSTKCGFSPLRHPLPASTASTLRPQHLRTRSRSGMPKAG